MSEPRPHDSQFTLKYGDWLHILPVCHYRAEFGVLARSAIQALQPKVVAVELPSSLKPLVLRAAERLPLLSVVIFPVDDGEKVYLPIEPIDAGIEAVRSALEIGAEVELVDLDVEGYADYRDRVPDSYAVHRVGLEAFHRAYRSEPHPKDPLDARREAAMAYRVQRLHREHGGPILLVCGMEHAESVRAQMGQAQGIPFARPQRPEAMVFHLDPDCLGEVLSEAPGLQAVYELLRTGALEPRPEPAADPDPGRQVGPFRILQGSGSGRGESLLVRLRELAIRSGWPLDRLRFQIALFDLAIQAWERTTGGTIRRWQREVFARYSRNLAFSTGRLVCDSYDFLQAVRGVGDENLVYEAFELLMGYPWQTRVSDLPTACVSAEELQLETQRIRIRPDFRRPKQRLVPLAPRRRREEYPGQWLAAFDETGLCSYPPEDLVIEGCAAFLRKKGTALLSEEGARVEPFRSSIMDGIDMRETLRHWATERRIYVRELLREPGNVGCVVVILDEDSEDERYPFRMTWLGEHEHESDMAFYASSPVEKIVGPGISRCEYGGFLMSYPPGRLMDVWNDPDYQGEQSKRELLLCAALDYSEERFIVHVAARPPESRFKRIAAQWDRRIIHIPLGQLSRQTLERIRVFHILAGRAKRQIAREYIG